MIKHAAVCAAFATLTALLASCTAEVDHTGSGARLGPEPILDPPQFTWTYHPASGGNDEYYDGTLEVGEATFTINGDTLTTRAYRQAGGEYSIPAPTITMVPGNKYVLHFHNLLPYETASTEHNVFKDPNIANIHTHGLHISGETPSDDVTRAFPGGFGGDFVYDIPADHMGGTYWYHAHHHGSTYLQVSGGMFGQLIIDDGNDGLPSNVAAMGERQVIVGYLDPGAAGTGGDTLMSGTLAPSWTVNGTIGGVMTVPGNEWLHWRVLLADRDASPRTLGIGAGCEVALLARDGVWRTEAPLALSSGEITLTGASRADLAVRCTSSSSITVNNNAVASVAVAGTGVSAPHPYGSAGAPSTWQAVRPGYLRDLRGVSAVNTESVRMGARTVNGGKFDHDVATLTLPANDVQEWSISGAARHPFHLHVYHMQALGCSGYEDGEYYDVIASNCSVRFDLSSATSTPYEGRTIMHCHILEHEDQGAMGWLDVTTGSGAAPPPTFPVDSGATFGALYPLGAAPVCGDMTCNGTEDQCSCAGDCGTPPGVEALCTDGVDEDCDGNVDCDDSDCSADAACATPFCGDLNCDAGEDSCSCPGDCGAPPSTETMMCTGGADEDCDGDVDCADADCGADAACSTTCGNGTCDAGEDCSSCSDCAGVTSGRPTNRYCCGDGTAQSAEGDGSICDGNY